MDWVDFIVITAAVFAARVLGDAVAAVFILRRAKKARTKQLAKLAEWETLLAEQGERGLAEITD